MRPIATGALADELRSVIAEIARVLPVEDPRGRVDAIADYAIFQAYTGAETSLDATADCLAHVAGPELFGGLARIGWTLTHLGDGDGVELACRSIDARLVDEALLSQAPFDLISGLVGIGVYGLERGEAGQLLVQRVVDELARRAVPRAGGLAWRDNDVWDLGLAHGVAGVIGFLARAHARADGARALLDGAIAYATASAIDGRFPSRETDPVSTRVAWCYGDLGVAMALLAAGMWVDESAWRDRGLALARACGERSLASSIVRDAGICHGAAGNAHLFGRIARACDDEDLAETARVWLRHTLAMRTAEPLAGFPHRRRDAAEPASTMLYGVAGIALAFHAAVTTEEPSWDRLLLADLPS